MMITACFRPYMPLLISTYTYPLPEIISSMLYNFQISARKYLELIHMYYGLYIGVSRKKSFNPYGKKIVPLLESKMMLLRSNFVSSINDVGDAVLSKYSGISPTMVSRTWNGYRYKYW